MPAPWGSAGQIALADLAGVDKVPFERKLFGIYPMRSLIPGHPLMGTQDDRFFCPQSRHAGLPDAAMESAQRQGRLRLLSHGEQVGQDDFRNPDQRQLMHLGHPEYNVGRILGEMERDRARGDVLPPRTSMRIIPRRLAVNATAASAVALVLLSAVSLTA